MARAPALAMGLAALLAGCASVEAPPPSTAAAERPAFRHSDPAVAAFDAAWLRGFADPHLDRLIARARAANHDVLIAAQRLREARAGSAAAATRRMPTVTVTGSASDTRTGLPDPVKAAMPDTRAYRAGLDLRWEVDVFGAARAAAEAAERDAQAADAGVAGAQARVTNEVARQYVLWQGARLRTAKLQALLQTQRDTERLVRSRFEHGEASRFDMARASGETQSLAATVPAAHALVDVTEHQIAVLLGDSPSDAVAGLDAAAPPALPAVPALAPGQPADLLRRRPDLQAAERQWQAEAARLREARADLWPKLFLGAVLGRQDLQLNLLDLAPVRYSNVALAFAMPLFDAGRLRAAIERQSARERIATLQYEKAVLAAVRDVEDSLVALAREGERRAAAEAAAEQRRVGLRHALSLHREGQIDLLQLLDAQRAVMAAELAGIDSATQQALAAVRLFEALGGGAHDA